MTFTFRNTFTLLVRLSSRRDDVELLKLEGHSVERITSDKGRRATAQLICVFVVFDLNF